MMYHDTFTPPPLEYVSHCEMKRRQQGFGMYVAVAVAVVLIAMLLAPPKQYQPLMTKCSSGMRSMIRSKQAYGPVQVDRLTTMKAVKEHPRVVAVIDTCVHCKNVLEKLKQMGVDFKTCTADSMGVSSVPRFFSYGGEVSFQQMVEPEAESTPDDSDDED